MFNLRNRSFLKELDFTAPEFRYLLDLSAALKATKRSGTDAQPASTAAAMQAATLLKMRLLFIWIPSCRDLCLGMRASSQSTRRWSVGDRPPGL